MTIRVRAAAALAAALVSTAALAGPDYSPSRRAQYPSPNLNRADVDTLVVRGQGSTGEIPNMTVGGVPLSSVLTGQDGKPVLTPDAVQIRGAGSTGDISGMKVLIPGGGSNPLTLGEAASAAIPIRSFGAPGANGDWSDAFAKAEAANPARVLLGPGQYRTGRKSFYHNIPYSGPGSATIVDVDGSSYPADFSQILTRPFGGTGEGRSKYFSADGRYSERDYRILQAGLRQGLDEPYYAPELSKQLSVYLNRAGSSGVLAQLTANTTVGATVVPLLFGSGDLSVGMRIAFSANNDTLNLNDPVTITAISSGSITVSPPLTLRHSAGDQITNGVRTMHARGHYEMEHAGYGDTYVNLFRVIGSTVPKDGQTHVFWTATAGIDGGDISATTDGQYFTGREVEMLDNGHDAAFAYDVINFKRNNDTGARGAFWVNNLAQSRGSRPVDANMVMAGKFRVGFDTTGAVMSSPGQAVINMSSGHGILWDSQLDRTERFPIWGKLYGKTWTGIEAGEWKLKRPGAGTQVDALAVTDGGQIRQPQKPMVVAEARSNITLSATYTTLKLASVYDALGDYDAATGRFTCRASGRYRIHVRLLTDAATAGNTGGQASVFKGGQQAIGGDSYIASAYQPIVSSSAETILPCSAGEFFEVRAKDAGNPGGILHGGPATAFAIEYLG
jgi:hypothetical protein